LANFITKRNGIRQIPLHYLSRDLAGELVRQLVCDLLWLNSITLSRSQTWSQTWFPTYRRQVQAISTCRDCSNCRHSSNLFADRFGPYSITLCCLLANSRAGQCNEISSRASLRPASELDSVMEFGFYWPMWLFMLTDKKTKSGLLKPNSITLVGSELVRSWFEAGSKPNFITLSESNQLRSSSEPAPNRLRTGSEPAPN